MNRRLRLACAAVLVATIVGSVSSCGDASQKVADAVSNDDEKAQEALDDYRDEMTPLGEREEELLERYASVQGANYTTDRAMYRVVSTDLPEWVQLSDDFQQIEVEDDELADIHDVYIEATAARIRGFTLLLSGLENFDRRAIADANDAIGEGNQLVREWGQDMDEFVEDVEG
ncbi:hypothetical protein [Nocardioides sp. SR21]|uniref:hypothetical protein n=1 Tax=Nocardioides sp. SR21 TaxID=2919501 RepID=UPI001FAA47C4|nr:hypothetical protein [Nocardioides sp. SR21]